MPQVVAGFIAGIFFAVAIGCELYSDEAQGGGTEGTTYYISASEGDDSRTGTSEDAPWQTLEKVSSVTFEPGDRVLLKRNDTWEESLFPRGQGSSEEWITLSAYGEGERPVIAPGKDAKWGIFLDNYAGWKIAGLEVRDAQAGIRFLNSEPGEKDGLWVEDCYIHDIEGAPQHPNSEEPGLYMSYGLSTYRVHDKDLDPLTNVTIKNVVVENTDAPVTIAGVENLLVDNLSTNNSYKAGVLFSIVRNGVMRNSRVLNTGYPKGMYWGVAGVQFNSCEDFVLKDSEIAYTRSPGSPDGIGVDYEGSNRNVKTLRCHIHHNESSAFLVYKNPSWGTDNENTSIVDCVMEYNGLKSISRIPAFLRHRFNHDNGGTISGNTIRKFEGQWLNDIDAFEPTLTNEWPEGYTIEDNTVEVMKAGEYADYNRQKPIEVEFAEVWRFEDDGDSEAWTWETPRDAVENVEVRDGFLRGDIVARDPHVTSPDGLDVDMEKYPLVVVKLRNRTDATLGEIFFTTHDDPEFNRFKYRSFPINANEPEHTKYIIDMTYEEYWEGRLRQFRVDPIDNHDDITGSFSIDYIGIGRPPEERERERE